MDKISEKKDIYHIYELEAQKFSGNNGDFFWKNFLKTASIFIFTIFIVYSIINFRFISSQLADWRQGRNYQIASIFYEDDLSVKSQKYSQAKFQKTEDSDGDGLPDELEMVFGTKKREADSDNDGVDDGAELLSGQNPRGEGFLSGAISDEHNNRLKVRWEGELPSDNRKDLLALRAFPRSTPLEGIFVVYPRKTLPDHLASNLSLGDKITMEISSNSDSNFEIEALYQVSGIKIVDSLDELEEAKGSIRIAHGHPAGSDWKIKIFETKLINIKK